MSLSDLLEDLRLENSDALHLELVNRGICGANDLLAQNLDALRDAGVLPQRHCRRLSSYTRKYGRVYPPQKHRSHVTNGGASTSAPAHPAMHHSNTPSHTHIANPASNRSAASRRSHLSQQQQQTQPGVSASASHATYPAHVSPGGASDQWESERDSPQGKPDPPTILLTEASMDDMRARGGGPGAAAGSVFAAHADTGAPVLPSRASRTPVSHVSAASSAVGHPVSAFARMSQRSASPTSAPPEAQHPAAAAEVVSRVVPSSHHPRGSGVPPAQQQRSGRTLSPPRSAEGATDEDDPWQTADEAPSGPPYSGIPVETSVVYDGPAHPINAAVAAGASLSAPQDVRSGAASASAAPSRQSAGSGGHAAHEPPAPPHDAVQLERVLRDNEALRGDVARLHELVAALEQRVAGAQSTDAPAPAVPDSGPALLADGPRMQAQHGGQPLHALHHHRVDGVARDHAVVHLPHVSPPRAGGGVPHDASALVVDPRAPRGVGGTSVVSPARERRLRLAAAAAGGELSIRGALAADGEPTLLCHQTRTDAWGVSPNNRPGVRERVLRALDAHAGAASAATPAMGVPTSPAAMAHAHTDLLASTRSYIESTHAALEAIRARTPKAHGTVTAVTPAYGGADVDDALQSRLAAAYAPHLSQLGALRESLVALGAPPPAQVPRPVTPHEALAAAHAAYPQLPAADAAVAPLPLHSTAPALAAQLHPLAPATPAVPPAATAAATAAQLAELKMGVHALSTELQHHAMQAAAGGVHDPDATDAMAAQLREVAGLQEVLHALGGAGGGVRGASPVREAAAASPTSHVLQPLDRADLRLAEETAAHTELVRRREANEVRLRAMEERLLSQREAVATLRSRVVSRERAEDVPLSPYGLAASHDPAPLPQPSVAAGRTSYLRGDGAAAPAVGVPPASAPPSIASLRAAMSAAPSASAAAALTSLADPAAGAAVEPPPSAASAFLKPDASFLPPSHVDPALPAAASAHSTSVQSSLRPTHATHATQGLPRAPHPTMASGPLDASCVTGSVGVGMRATAPLSAQDTAPVGFDAKHVSLVAHSMSAAGASAARGGAPPKSVVSSLVGDPAFRSTAQTSAVPRGASAVDKQPASLPSSLGNSAFMGIGASAGKHVSVRDSSRSQQLSTMRVADLAPTAPVASATLPPSTVGAAPSRLSAHADARASTHLAPAGVSAFTSRASHTSRLGATDTATLDASPRALGGPSGSASAVDLAHRQSTATQAPTRPVSSVAGGPRPAASALSRVSAVSASDPSAAPPLSRTSYLRTGPSHTAVPPSVGGGRGDYETSQALLRVQGRASGLQSSVPAWSKTGSTYLSALR